MVGVAALNNTLAIANNNSSSTTQSIKSKVSDCVNRVLSYVDPSPQRDIAIKDSFARFLGMKDFAALIHAEAGFLKTPQDLVNYKTLKIRVLNIHTNEIEFIELQQPRIAAPYTIVSAHSTKMDKEVLPLILSGQHSDFRTLSEIEYLVRKLRKVVYDSTFGVIAHIFSKIFVRKPIQEVARTPSFFEKNITFLNNHRGKIAIGILALCVLGVVTYSSNLILSESYPSKIKFPNKFALASCLSNQFNDQTLIDNGFVKYMSEELGGATISSKQFTEIIHSEPRSFLIDNIQSQSFNEVVVDLNNYRINFSYNFRKAESPINFNVTSFSLFSVVEPLLNLMRITFHRRNMGRILQIDLENSLLACSL